jgi:hypothetical protein
MNIKEADEKFEQWRKEQIASLIRTGHLEAAKAFEQLGSIHWMAWQCAWQASRESLVITLPANRHELELSGEDLVPDENGSLIYLHDLIEHLEALGLKVRL